MPNTIKRFIFAIDRTQPLDPVVKGPTVTIELDFGGRTGHGGAPAVTAPMTESEIDWEIQALKKDLDECGRKAKAALAAARGRAIAAAAPRSEE